MQFVIDFYKKQKILTFFIRLQLEFPKKLEKLNGINNWSIKQR